MISSSLVIFHVFLLLVHVTQLFIFLIHCLWYIVIVWRFSVAIITPHHLLMIMSVSLLRIDSSSSKYILSCRFFLVSLAIHNFLHVTPSSSVSIDCVNLIWFFSPSTLVFMSILDFRLQHSLFLFLSHCLFQSDSFCLIIVWNLCSLLIFHCESWGSICFPFFVATFCGCPGLTLLILNDSVISAKSWLND